jgi:thioredoxin reductase (NADPH)
VIAVNANPRYQKYMSETIKTDIAIIGAGPVGLFTVFQAGMLGMSCQVIDALPALGGQLTALYPEKPIYDIAGHPHILAGDLVAALTTQARPFNAGYHLNQTVDKISGNHLEGFTLTTSRNISITAKAIIIAAGAGAFGPNRPPLDGITAFENQSVHYMVTEKALFKNKTLLIAGGGDSAVDWALTLYDEAAHIYFIHRRNQFRAMPDNIKKLLAYAETPKLDILTPYQLKGVRGENGKLSAVLIEEIENESTQELAVDHLLAFFGLATSLGAIAHFGLALDRNHITIDPTTAETSIKGIYAVGDIATYPHKLKLILTGFAEAAAAAHHAYPLVFGGKTLHFEYSTTKGITKGS